MLGWGPCHDLSDVPRREMRELTRIHPTSRDCLAGPAVWQSCSCDGRVCRSGRALLEADLQCASTCPGSDEANGTPGVLISCTCAGGLTLIGRVRVKWPRPQCATGLVQPRLRLGANQAALLHQGEAPLGCVLRRPAGPRQHPGRRVQPPLACAKGSLRLRRCRPPGGCCEVRPACLPACQVAVSGHVRCQVTLVGAIHF